MNICIFTHKREECFWKAYTPIKNMILDGSNHSIHIFKDGSEELYSEEFYKQKEIKGVRIHETEDSMGISWQKEEARKKCSKNHTFFIEDDCVVTNVDVFKKCIDFAKRTGLKHFNWNSYRKPASGYVEVGVDNFEVNTECEASFQFFHKDVMDQFFYDTGFKNALDHIDVEMQLCRKHVQPPFRCFCSPSGLEEFLEQIETESTISYDDGEVESSHKYWVDKWGTPLMSNPVFYHERAIMSLNRIKRDYGEKKSQQKKRGRKKKPNPVSVVITVKDRSSFFYKTKGDVLEKELHLIKMFDTELASMEKTNGNRGGLKYSKEYFKDPNGFRMLDSFVETLNKVSKEFKGDVELVVADFSSKDDDVLEILKCLCTNIKFKYIEIPYEEKFSRGYGINQAIYQGATHERIFIADVDLVFLSPEILEITSSLEETEVVSPPLLKEVVPSGMAFRMEIASFGLMCLHKSLFIKAGGMQDIRKWGLEDSLLAESIERVIGFGKIHRKDVRTMYHKFHSDSHRGL